MRFAVLSLLLCACAVHPGATDDSSDDDANNDSPDASTDDGSQTQDDSSTTTEDSSTTTQLSTNVSIIVEPDGKAGAQVVSAINAEKTSVHMTMYLLSNTDVINALIARHKAGADVKVLLDSSSTTDNGRSTASSSRPAWASRGRRRSSRSPTKNA